MGIDFRRGWYIPPHVICDLMKLVFKILTPTQIIYTILYLPTPTLSTHYITKQNQNTIILLYQ